PKGVLPGAARMAGGLLGNLWSMTLGYSAGVIAAAPIAGRVAMLHPYGRVAGALITAAGAGAGTFGLPASIDSLLERKINEGNINVKDVHKRAWDMLQDSAKEYVFGSVVGVLSPASKLLGLPPIARFAAESTALTYGQGAIEGKWPTAEDW